MIKRIFLFVFAFYVSTVSNAQVPTPGEFLGYELGEKYTPHWKVLDYFRKVAEAVPSLMKIEEYGKTYEGRTLLVSYVSSSSNISQLEKIRLNNLGLARMNEGGSLAKAPVIVWLSYNVHGNETSSSEAAMKTLYSLVDPENQNAKEWLQNTIVIIDPCLNPDGRDRYVNWFNSVAGTSFNPSPDAREHREPWPGGRTNHYNFDLNRDWAWQTQIESEQRLQLYHRWMPQVHVDFHEQGINNPYYFAPAAQPYHEVITPWQRDFQHTIGRNHARYFDSAGWLYFTREIFDLLYPSYGDTYPTYNGAIGMTYEQAGGPAGGAAALTADGDTLTLSDRINHHFTTGMSTIEVSSEHAERLLSEFNKYFNEAVSTGIGKYKSYVIRYDEKDQQQLQSLFSLLEKNKIESSYARPGTYKGFNYENGKEENFSVSSNDILISAKQPQGALVKVLFEPNTLVVDSNTYDITAWSLPYVYGLKAYASTQIIPKDDREFTGTTNKVTPSNPYAYVIPWNGTKSVKLVGDLLQKGIRLRISEQPFESGKKSFDRGSVIVLKTGNQYFPDLWNEVVESAEEAGVELTAVTSGFVDKGSDFGSSHIRPLKARKVALITGEGISSNSAGEVWYYFEQVIKYPVTLINLSDISRVRLSEYDVVILPHGSYRFLSDKAQAEEFINWIRDGGHVVALEGAVSQLSRLDWSLKPRKSDDTDSGDIYSSLRKYEDRERDFIPNITPGSIFRVELDNTHPLAFGYPDHYYTLKQDDDIYEFIKSGGWNVGILRKENQVAGFVGSRLQEKLQDGLLFGVQDIGNGTVTYLTDNVLFRSFWENGRLMFANAVFLVGQ